MVYSSLRIPLMKFDNLTIPWDYSSSYYFNFFMSFESEYIYLEIIIEKNFIWYFIILRIVV